ncbi:MAG: hypothetical protein E4H01_11905 [Lysobacterales bacterium]|nr:MAG: hypothetical protein E4H01_11905 [Xanthomonadales bacterium]
MAAGMIDWFFGTPRFFNYLIMTLYCINALWWLGHGKLADACYWISACAITATVTWGYKH